MSDFARWLDGIGLAQYGATLVAEDIDLEVAAALSDGDLERLGLSLGHRRRFMAAAVRLKEAGVGPAAPPASVTAPTAPARDASTAEDAQVERRQVTVVFADIVDATALSSTLDPEDMQALLLRYRAACAAIIGRYGGHVAQYLGDGVLAYFGFPRGLEHAAERAIRAALEIARSAGAIVRPDGLPLQARLGIASGAVVSPAAGQDGDGTVVGETPNLAARLQALASPGTVLVSESTKRLGGDFFEFAAAQDHAVKGFAGTQRVWPVLRERVDQSRFAAASASTGSIVGRERELAFLGDSLQRASAGEGHLVMIGGDAGMGKSRLSEAIVERAEAAGLAILRCQCSPYHRNSALHPFAQMLRQAAEIRAEQSNAEKLAAVAALVTALGRPAKSARVLVADLLELSSDESLSAMEMTPAQRKTETLQILEDFIAARAARSGLLLVFEDAHWIDPTSSALLEKLMRGVDRRSMLLLVTHRPEWVAGWGQHPNASSVQCKPLSAVQCAEMIRAIAAREAIDDGKVLEIVQRSDGVPLFAQELTRAVIELRGGNEAQVPVTLRDSLMARLDRLGAAKGVAQVASVFGREFEYSALAALVGLDAVQLDEALERLLQARLIFAREGDETRIYSFNHALIQEEAYESLAKARRVDLHRRVAALLQAAAARGGDVPPEVLAHHLGRAGDAAAACECWLQAAERARAGCAFAEALAHLHSAQGEAARIADAKLAGAQALRTQLEVGAILLLQNGPQADVVEAALATARDMAGAAGAGRELFQATWGLYLHAASNLRLENARRYGDELLGISERLDDDDLRMEALHHRWGIAYFFGDTPGILEHTTTAFGRYDRQRHHHLAHVYAGHDPGACAHCVHALGAALAGRPETMERELGVGLALAESLEHPLSLAFAIGNESTTRWIAGDREGSARSAERLVSVAGRYALTIQQSLAAFMLGLHESACGDAAAGAAIAERHFKATRRQGFLTVFPTIAMTDALARAGRGAAALDLVDATLTNLPVQETGLHVSELWRQRGELRAAAARHLTPAAEHDLRAAIAIAARQGAGTYRLRAALALSRLLHAHRRSAEARSLLEATDTSGLGGEPAELLELRALTAELGNG